MLKSINKILKTDAVNIHAAYCLFILLSSTGRSKVRVSNITVSVKLACKLKQAEDLLTQRLEDPCCPDVIHTCISIISPHFSAQSIPDLDAQRE